MTDLASIVADMEEAREHHHRQVVLFDDALERLRPLIAPAATPEEPDPGGVGGAVGRELESTPPITAPACAVDSAERDNGRETTAEDGARNLPADSPTNPTRPAARPVTSVRSPATSVRASRPPTVVTVEAAEILAVLDHPEWIDGAIQAGGYAASGWVRTDGMPWECSCGKKARTIGHLRSHMRTVVDPANHQPQIAVTGGQARPVAVTDPQPAPPAAPAAEPPPPSAPAVPRPPVDLHRRAAELAVTPAPWPRRPPRPRQQPPTEADSSLPWGCSCGSRHPTARDWNHHRKQQPTGLRNRHRLTDQPPAHMIPTGIPTRPPRRDDDPVAPHIVQTHHTGPGRVIA